MRESRKTPLVGLQRILEFSAMGRLRARSLHASFSLVPNSCTLQAREGLHSFVRPTSSECSGEGQVG